MADFILSQVDIDQFKNNNATLFIDGVEAQVDDVIPESGTGVFLEAVADDGYIFTSGGFPSPTPNLSLWTGWEERYFSMDFGDKRGTLSQVNADQDADFYVETESTADYVIDEYDMSLITASNVTLFVNQTEASEGTPVEDYDELEMYPNEGFIIISVTSQDYSYMQLPWTVEPDGSRAYISYEYDWTQFLVDIVTEQVASETVGTNNVYLIDSDILEIVNNERFVLRGGAEGHYVDYGTYILGLIILPTEIPEDDVLAPTRIQLGNEQLSVLAPELSSDTIAIDMGEIQVPATYGDSRDFENTLCNLHLPNAGTITVESEYVIGQTLKIEYLVDSYTGKATINLYSTKLGEECFYTHNTTLGINVPYASDSWSNLGLDNSNIDIGGDNKLTNAYVEVLRNDSPLADKFFTIPVTDESLLSEQTGYIEVENVELNFTALADELQQIETILSGGVIIS